MTVETMDRNLKKVARFCADSNGAFSEGMVRWWIFKAEDNGLADAGAIVRIGRALWIDVDKFNTWLDKQATPKAAA
jgi:hypothetical protein